MATIIVLILLTIFIIYLLLGFLFAESGNKFLDKWLGRTLWLWLPFRGLYYLIKKSILKIKGEK